MNPGIAWTETNEPITTDYDPELPLYSPSPTYSASTLTCANTYCHGYFKNGKTTFSPVWTDTTGLQAACGTCHGDVNKPTLAERALPKTLASGGTHPILPPPVTGSQCAICHGEVVDVSLNIINKSKHINGKLNILGEERDF